MGIVDNHGRPFREVTTNHDFGVRANRAARRLWLAHEESIARTTPEVKTHGKAVREGFALGVACLLLELHEAEVDIDHVLGVLDL